MSPTTCTCTTSNTWQFGGWSDHLGIDCGTYRFIDVVDLEPVALGVKALGNAASAGQSEAGSEPRSQAPTVAIQLGVGSPKLRPTA